MLFNTPILFLTFNRPDLTKIVFEKIKDIKPSRLYWATDGPRGDHPDDAEKVKKVHEIAKKIGWPCELMTLFRDTNLGCKLACSGAISWFFENENMGIILEDDCLPSQSFFMFCEELLIRYQDNSLVNAIGGRNALESFYQGSNSYFFSKYNRVWGWATWKRAWAGLDMNMSDWKNFKNTEQYKSWFSGNNEKTFFEDKWKQCISEKIDTWDFQWYYHRLKNGGLTAVPTVNLIANIGLGHQDATHTLGTGRSFLQSQAQEIPFPLIHPDSISIDRRMDEKLFQIRSKLGLKSKTLSFLKQLIFTK
ncbi:glycosyl transferase [Thermodesulfobacteriota bacterium]